MLIKLNVLVIDCLSERNGGGKEESAKITTLVPASSSILSPLSSSKLTVDIKHTFCPSGIKAVDTPVLLYKRVEAGKYELACKLRDKQR
ncbi:hypothetical protein PRIPAC_90628 [Pristionchus pacificus]|uniref:Uncharacterized protein n=1 Tax=Pristionchus pacificus TaxID=54126 RepID=A0A2A6B8I0_PRIPA|nr:hypothetical protein PRIPAC_90628 [Pristionchus pacificus]|eukprot:PDM62190.1 hypothetical protein PRIPAC_51632 [Pristionchus pacificus]